MRNKRADVNAYVHTLLFWHSWACSTGPLLQYCRSNPSFKLHELFQQTDQDRKGSLSLADICVFAKKWEMALNTGIDKYARSCLFVVLCASLAH